MPIQTVMMVDDEEDIRKVGEISLSMVGNWRTVMASGAKQALELAVRESPDVILLDVMMPEVDGPTAFGWLKDAPATAGIPIIFMTAKVQTQEVGRYLQMGAVGVIPKPFDSMELPGQIRRMIEVG